MQEDSSLLTLQLVRLVKLVGWLRPLNSGQGILRKTAWIPGKWYVKNLLPLAAHADPVGWNHLHTQIMFQLMERFFVFSGIHSPDIQEFPPNGG